MDSALVKCLTPVVNNVQGGCLPGPCVCGILGRDTLAASPSCSLLKDCFISMQIDSDVFGSVCYSEHQFP